MKTCGTINYSKLLLTIVDPVIVKILQENSDEDDDYPKIILCPDFNFNALVFQEIMQKQVIYPLRGNMKVNFVDYFGYD